MLRTSTRRRLVLAAASALLLAASLGAAPAIKGVDFTRDETGERMLVRWTSASAVTTERFPEARQVVFTLRGASVEGDIRALALPTGGAIERARVQEVTMDDGSAAVQVTLTLKSGATVEPVVSERALTLVVNPGEATPAVTPRDGGWSFTNEDVERYKADPDAFGIADAPVTGAGQAGAGSRFYVPPDLSGAERAKASGTDDQSILRNDERYREMIKSLDLKDAELLFVIRGFARKTGMNVIANPAQVQGRISLALQNVTVGDAFEAILKANNLAYKVEPGGIVRIVPREEVRTTEKETVTQAIQINWISADEAKGAVSPFLTEDAGQAEVAKGSNVLIVREVPENMTRVQELLRRIDTPEKQVKVELRLVDMNEEAQRQFGFRTSVVSKDTITQTGMPGTTGQTDRSSGTGTIGGRPLTSPTLDWVGRNNWHVLGQEYQFEWNLQASETRGDSTTLANPVVVTLNNLPAKIEIIRKVAYLSAQQSGDGSVATIETVDTGILIDLLPRITNNGYIQLNIAPQQKILRGFQTIGGTTSSREYPIVDERSVLTNVIVKDEDTVALGGLRQFASLQSQTGVPFLLRAPVLGWFFRSQSAQQNKTELVLFVTPRIIKDTGTTPYENALYDKIDYNWDLPDYYFDQVAPRNAPGEIPDPYTKYKK